MENKFPEIEGIDYGKINETINKFVELLKAKDYENAIPVRNDIVEMLKPFKALMVVNSFNNKNNQYVNEETKELLKPIDEYIRTLSVEEKEKIKLILIGK